MKIILAEHFGMCFGVRDAIAEAERLASDGSLTILGQLVHNPVVRERLRQRGVLEGDLDESSGARSTQVLITAHGASDAKRKAWRAAGYTVADGTCPLVRRAHEQLRRLAEAGFCPVVIGQRGHVEVQGLTGDFPGAFVIESLADIAALPEGKRRFGVISQTTQPLAHVHSLVSAMRRARPEAEVKFCDTVCQPTKNRQNALQQLLATCDTIVVVGGYNSNNTRQLVAAAQARNRRAIHIERPEELRPQLFEGAENVGLTAGTSTLPETVAAVHVRLREIAAR
ncbi:MAG TPA: 4-hydroxy-3-methylbut-2-enyl diphosphate reductase [Chthoniobacterales bacterium]|nr:4-hydroxy-3-methylbut-2-enyl diphosphate reductase [Chthoniobacterales bacterium]